VGRGFITPASALRDYGVAVFEGKIDSAATAARRASARAESRKTEFTFGAARDTWDAIFDDETMHTLNMALFSLPRSLRSTRRRRFFAAVLNDMPATGVMNSDHTPVEIASFRERVRAALGRELNDQATAGRLASPPAA
jgi:hypothetical protein